MLPVLASGDPPLIFFVVVAVGVAVWIFMANREARERVTTWQRFARTIGGTFTDSGILASPRYQIGFPCGGRRALLELFSGSRNSSPYSRVVVGHGRSSPGTLHILKEGFGRSFLKLFGAQDILIGDAAFDDQYVIKAEPESFAGWMFRADRRGAVIAAVRRIAGYSDPTIDIDRYSLTVTVRLLLEDEADLKMLVDTAEQFLGFLSTREAAPGIQLGEVRTIAGSGCPVCGTPMQEQVVNCGTCRTPHHLECWDYMGRCSTYACKGRRSVA